MARRKAEAADSALAAGAASDDALLTLLAAGLRLQSTDDGRWKVSGNTLAHREALRGAGGTWNKLDQCWEFAGEDPTARLAAALAAAPAPPGHNSGATDAPKPHYHGHRQRVRERVLAAGVEALADYELLELLLFYSIQRIDTKPLAKRLLERFGTLGDVFAAEPQQLREFDIDQRTLVQFKAIEAATRHFVRGKVSERPVLSSWSSVLEYCRAAMAFADKEQFRILFLDKKNQLITDEVQQTGTVDHTPVYPREVVKRALELSATAVILVHNHPTQPISITLDHAPNR